MNSCKLLETISFKCYKHYLFNSVILDEICTVLWACWELHHHCCLNDCHPFHLMVVPRLPKGYRLHHLWQGKQLEAVILQCKMMNDTYFTTQRKK